MKYIKKNKRYIVLFLIFFILFFSVVLKKIGKVSINELLFGSSLKKVERHIDRVSNLGYKINVTYLLYNGNKKDVELTKNTFIKTLIRLDGLSDENQHFFYRDKLSLKINQLGLTFEEKMENLIEILEFARDRNIMVWISSHKRTDSETEFSVYKNLRKKGYDNVGITLAAYHNSFLSKVQEVLDMGGITRIVKGYYKDGEIQDWNLVTQNYYQGARLLFLSGTNHQIAGHDFDNIIVPLHKEFNLNENTNMEFGFFLNSIGYVEKQLQENNITLRNKYALITFGKIYRYLKSNIKDISFKRSIKAKAFL